MKIKHIGFFLNDAIFLAERVMDDLVGYCDMEHTKQGTICHLQIVVDGKIVRCKDCSFWGTEQDGYCAAIDDPYMLETEADDFCSRGERR